jgi:hypothetical protein
MPASLLWNSTAMAISETALKATVLMTIDESRPPDSLLQLFCKRTELFWPTPAQRPAEKPATNSAR